MSSLAQPHSRAFIHAGLVKVYGGPVVRVDAAIVRLLQVLLATLPARCVPAYGLATSLSIG